MQRMRGYELLELQPLIMNRSLKIGTRGSKLALWQANWIKSAICSQHPDISVDLVTIKTKGDKILDVPLAGVGGKGLFVKEIEEALLEKRVDLAVHSMKDMPADLPAGLCIGPVPERENASDILISRNDIPLDALPRGARIGTSSLRRSAQLKQARPDITIVPLRGNLDTRLRKLDDNHEGLDAIVLAAAGVKRLGLEDRITERIEYSIMLPAVGQGALCLEIRKNDPVADILAFLDHPATRQAVLGERAFLHRLEGSCQVPIAAHGNIANYQFTIEGLVADIDGQKVLRKAAAGRPQLSEKIGIELAESLLAMGADTILAKLTADLKPQ
jgi:hydroxymethylbilane synthase